MILPMLGKYQPVNYTPNTYIYFKTALPLSDPGTVSSFNPSPPQKKSGLNLNSNVFLTSSLYLTKPYFHPYLHLYCYSQFHRA